MQFSKKTFLEEIFVSPTYVFVTFVKNLMAIMMWTYFHTLLFTIPLVYVSAFDVGP
jgi:hypothetical protein